MTGKIFSKINGTLFDHVDENSLSAEDEDSGVVGDPKNMRAERLAAITAAENALKAKENEKGKMDRKTNSSDNAPEQSTTKDEIITLKSSQEMGQKVSKDVGAIIEPNSTPLSSNSLPNEGNPVNSPQSQSRDSHLEVKKEESNTQQQGQKVVKERQRLQENMVMETKDKILPNSRIPDSDVRTNELTRPYSDQTQIEDIARKRVNNSKVQKTEHKEKTMNEKRFIPSYKAKKQSPENRARHQVQDLVQKADSALNDAQELTKQAKLANQKAQAAIEDEKSRKKDSQNDQEENTNIISPELTQLINEAKKSDKIAQDAIEKYDKLKRAANVAVEDFNTRFK